MYFRYTWLTGYIIGAAYAVWAKVKRNNKTVHAVNWLATSGYDDVKYWSAETMFSQVVDCSRLQDSRHYWIGRDNKTRWGRDEIGRWILRFIFAVTSNIRWGPSTIWQRGINYSNSRATGEKTRARADSRIETVFYRPTSRWRPINVLSRKKKEKEKKENNCFNNSKLVWFKPILCCFPKMLGFPNWPFLTCICLMQSVCEHWSFSNDNQPSLRLNINCDLIAEAKQFKCLTLLDLNM